MLYNYSAVTIEGEEKKGSIEASSVDVAVSALQSRSLIITEIVPVKEGSFLENFQAFKIFNRVKYKDIVILSRQLATLFEAKMAVLDSLGLLAGQTNSPRLKEALGEIIENIKGGSSLSVSISKHPDIFSPFYVSMVRSGEESGKLEEIFGALADHLERSYELTSKTKNALIYPAFVISTFAVVIVLMLTFVIPKLTSILTETGQSIPFYTRILIGVSNFFRDFGVFLLGGAVVGGLFLWRYARTENGKMAVSRFQTNFPFVGQLYGKFYLSRMTDNMETLLSSGVPAIRTLEIAADVVGNDVYKNILLEAAAEVKGGKSISEAISKHPEIPLMVTQMIKTGEETGKLNFMLKTLGKFYKKEVDNTVDTLVSLIEPIMIVVLGAGVGILLISILGPIYNITAGI
ncbi:type II secretion system F family protein [Candidatus Parcubacteria bacterium]|nr:MAG: type II secretion system F family protein [Candidatus Parcubacteria bacterium]